MNYYYHLTQPEFITAIQKEGLKPMLGKRSKSIGDKEERLCLCSESSIDAWSIMLGTNTVIKVAVPDEDKMKLVDQGNVSDEYNYDGIIPPEYIVDIFTANPSKIILNKLRYNYMWGLSEFCTYCARYYTELDSENTDEEYLDALKDAIQVTGELLIPVIPKLCYPEMPKEERKEILKSIGNQGAYTFCDDYYVKVEAGKPIKRLYQMLTEYPEDDLTEIRTTINKLIKDNFKYCLRVNTGGFTG